MALSERMGGTIAVLDSGVGGLTVLAELRLLLPAARIVYYADTAHCPYGGRSEDEIVELTHLAVERVIAQGAEVVVLACNTMTTVAISSLRERWPMVDFVGIQPALKPALLQTHSGTVGVLATRATLAGDSYRHIHDTNIATGQRVIEVAGDGLVEFVEGGKHLGAECRELLQSYVEPMLEGGADVIVLGCTHYPFLVPVLEELVDSRSVIVINPAPSVAARTKLIAEERGMQLGCEAGENCGGKGASKKGDTIYMSSGTEAQCLFLEGFLATQGIEF